MTPQAGRKQQERTALDGADAQKGSENVHCITQGSGTQLRRSGRVGPGKLWLAQEAVPSDCTHHRFRNNNNNTRALLCTHQCRRPACIPKQLRDIEGGEGQLHCCFLSTAADVALAHSCQLRRAPAAPYHPVEAPRPETDARMQGPSRPAHRCGRAAGSCGGHWPPWGMLLGRSGSPGRPATVEAKVGKTKVATAAVAAALGCGSRTQPAHWHA